MLISFAVIECIMFAVYQHYQHECLNESLIFLLKKIWVDILPVKPLYKTLKSEVYVLAPDLRSCLY